MNPSSSEDAPKPNSQGLQLDPDLYSLTPEESEFFKLKTGIHDDEELKQHIIRVQTEAWEVFPYRCILGFAFTKLRISRLPGYGDLLQLGKSRPGALFIDIGCCVGTDVRKAITDGYPAEYALASDLQPEFWDLGYKLFKDSPATLPVHFIPGDVFNPSHIAPSAPFYEPPSTPRPDLSSLTSLTPLQGHLSAIHTSAFFHLFGKEEQIRIARLFASLLSPEPGSMIFGAHGSQPTAGLRASKSSRGNDVYCFPPEDWKALWDGEIFTKGTVTVEATLTERAMPNANRIAPPGSKFYVMAWSVKRI